MNKVISVMAAATLGVGVMAMAPAAKANPAPRNVDALAASVPLAEYTQYRHRRHGHYRARRGYGNAAGAAAFAGVAGALIGGAIAAQNQRQYYYEQPYGYHQQTYYQQPYGYGRQTYYAQPYQSHGYYGHGGVYDDYD